MADAGVLLNEGEEQAPLRRPSETDTLLLRHQAPSVDIAPSPSHRTRGNLGTRSVYYDLEPGPSGNDRAGSNSGGSYISPPVDTETTEWSRELSSAITERNVALVRRLLAEGAPFTGNALAEFALNMFTDVYTHPILDKFTLTGEERRARENEILQVILDKADQTNTTGEVSGGPSLSCKPLLVMAIENNDLMTVKALVKAGADMEGITDINETVLHMAVDNPDILKYFLDNHNVPNIPNKRGSFPVHYAAQIDNVEPMRLLLQKFGGQQLILRNNIGWTVWHSSANRNTIAIAKHLLQTEYAEYRSSINMVDNYGDTPVNISAAYGLVALTGLLLKNGATLSAKGWKHTVVEQIAKKFAEPLTFFEKLFDDCISHRYTKPGKVSIVSIDYKVLEIKRDKQDTQYISQIKVVKDLVRCGLSDLLKHPTIESLIFLKWKCLLPVFVFMMFVYASFLIVLNTLVITRFSNIQTNNTNNGTTDAAEPVTKETYNEGCGYWDQLMIVLIYILIAILFVQEILMWCMKFRLKWHLMLLLKSCKKIHLKSSLRLMWNSLKPSLKLNIKLRWESLKTMGFQSRLKLILTLLTKPFTMCIKLVLRLYNKFRIEPCIRLCGLSLAASVPALVGCAPAPAPAPWQRHAACAALLLAWLQAMLLLSRFPGWGYVLMLKKIAVNTYKVLVTLVCMLVAFAVCFMVQYQLNPPFDGFGVALVKIVAMTSEYEYEGLLDEKHKELEGTRSAVRLLFVVFVIFVPIIMINVNVGVALNDINELTTTGHIETLKRQVELISAFEDLGDTALGRWLVGRWKNLSRMSYHDSVTQVAADSSKQWITNIPRLECEYGYLEYTVEYFPSELEDAIHNIAKNKRNLDNIGTLLNDQAKTHNDGDISNASTELQDKIKSIEETNKQLIEANKELKQSMDDLKKDMKDILRIVANQKNTVAVESSQGSINF